jgi:hypothetical protein
MKLNKLLLTPVLFAALTSQLMAAPNHHLQTEREQVIRQYILDLERADVADISNLFEEDGYVKSTSRGTANAREFFKAFLPLIDTASTEYHQGFINSIDENRFAARFHYEYTLKDGEVGKGEYVDEFVFSNNSAKLKSVFMFENLKFD